MPHCFSLFFPHIPHKVWREQEDRATCCGIVASVPMDPNGRHKAMERTPNRQTDRIRYFVLCALVVVMVTWVTFTVVSSFASGMADAIFR